jgi:hypothetical protein
LYFVCFLITGTVQSIRNGLPSLGAHSISDSPPSLATHKNITGFISNIIELPIDFRIANESAHIPSIIWAEAATVSGLTWANEEGIKRYVISVLKDCCNLSGFELECHAEIGLLNLRPDVYVVTKFGDPVGVVEVKRPSACDEFTLADNNVLGQAALYLDLLRQRGVQHAFCIITTYNSWRVVWHSSHSTCEYLHSVSLNSSTPMVNECFFDAKSRLSQSLACLGLPKWTLISNTMDDTIAMVAAASISVATTTGVAGNAVVLLSTMIETSAAATVMFTDMHDALETSSKSMISLEASPIITRDSDKIIPFITFVIAAMYRSPHMPKSSVLEVRPCVLVNSAGVWWKMLPALKEPLYSLPPTNTSTFYLIADFRGGVDGRVHLATSLSGHIVVLKFHDKVYS